jgi:hypothetical protein
MPRPAVTTLCRAIQDALESGLPQDAATLAAIAAATGLDSPGALGALLADRDDPEAAVARALLLFPGDAVKTALEPLLAATACSAADAREAAGLLAATGRRALIVFPDGSRLELALAPEDAATFAARLRLENTLPQALGEAVRSRCEPHLALRVAVLLRHAPTPLTGPTCEFVAAALLGAAAEGEILAELAAYAVRFAGGLAPGEPPAQALGRRYRTVAGQIKQAQRLAHALTQSSFEVMISQGARLPHLHEEDLRRELVLLNLCARAFGLSGAGACSEVIDRDLGDGLDAEDIIERFGGLDGFF